MRKLFVASLVLLCAACQKPESKPSYLYVWAGDSTEKSSDFLAVINADPSSSSYGSIVTSLPTGEAGTHPHHTELEMPTNGHLLANGFHAGRTFLFDLTTPAQPKILTSFGDIGGYSHPHTYARLANGNLLTTFQYRADSGTAAPHVMAASATSSMNMPGMSSSGHSTGALVEMDERGTVIRAGSARDTTITDRLLFPYSALALPTLDRVVSTTTDMDHADTVATAEWVQFWKLSDLSLIKSIALTPGPRGNEHRFTGELRVLPDGKSVYIHTFNCGLYLLRDIDQPSPVAKFVMAFDGTDCGVPILTGHYWLQPVPARHALVAYDITDPEHPREVSSAKVGDDEQPHWIALDPTGRRVVLNSGGSAGNRLFVINFDPANGTLAVDERFKDAGASKPGVSMSGKTWPHGFTGVAIPHGTVFSR